jgi:CBS domain-containing protein
VSDLELLDVSLAASDVMSSPALSVDPETSIWTAWSIMTSTGLRHLVVAVDGRCVGIVDDRTVFAQWPMGPLALRRRRVSAIMRQRTSCVLPDVDVRDVAMAMARDAVDAVPVVDVDGTLLGIVTSSDITRAVAVHGLGGRGR